MRPLGYSLDEWLLIGVGWAMAAGMLVEALTRL